MILRRVRHTVNLILVALPFVIALCWAAEAAGEEPMFGMGRRHYLGEGRLDITYTTELATPHVDWADRYVLPISAYAIPSVMEGRTLVELMQRLSMKVDAVTIDPAWDVNKWTMSFGEAYGARSEQNADGTIDYGFVYNYLQEDLSSDRTWDVMIMHDILGWGHLPEAVRHAILQRVQHGMGLVLVGPRHAGEGLDAISALLPVGDAPASGSPGREDPPRGDWAASGEHFITHGVPLETLPGQHLRHLAYRPTDGATVLATAGDDPVVAVREVGRGRVVSFGYENYGLAPFIRWDAYGDVGDAWWETWYSLFVRSIVWAARKEPAPGIAALSLDESSVGTHRAQPVAATVHLTAPPEHAAVRWQLRRDDGAVVQSGAADLAGEAASFAIPVSQLHGGRYLVDVFLLSGEAHADWASAPLRVEPAVGVGSVTADPSVVSEAVPLRVTVAFEEALPEGISLVVELVDNYQRVIAHGVPSFLDSRTAASAELCTDDLLTHIGWVRATLWQGARRLDMMQTRVDFATPDRLRAWDDYEVNIPFYGPQNYYHWMPLVDEQYRRVGVTWLMEPERNFRFTVLAQPTGLGVYHYDRKPFEEQMEAYWQSGDRKYLVRNPCLHQDWRQTARAEIIEKIEPFLKYRPFHYYLYDEPSLTSYTWAFDFCYSPETTAAFREWLKGEYGTLKALNAEWGSGYRRWSQVEPPTTEEAQQHRERIPAWADFRHFMDLTFAEAMRYAQQVVDELDPGALTLVGGTQRPTPFNGTDWWLMSHAFGILEPYSGIDEFRSFDPDLPIIQACGYQDAGPELEEELWRRFLRGQRGATIFWNYTFHDPDLALNSQGVAMAHAFEMLRTQGIARLLIGATRDDGRIAILYSQPSMHAAWIQDGAMREGRRGRSERAVRHGWSNVAWQSALHTLGFPFHYLSYEQLAREGVDRSRFDVLVLPDAIALSDAEVKSIHTFVAANGVVLADGEPGTFDEHCKPRPTPVVKAGARVHLVAWPADKPVDAFADFAGPILAGAGIPAPALVSAPVAQLVRYTDGDAEYVAVVGTPAQAHRIGFPCAGHIYDVRNRRYLGEGDEVGVPAGQNRVALYAILPAEVSAVKVIVPEHASLGGEVRYAVKAEADAAYRHVFAVQVYGPDGKLRPMYGANLDADDGETIGRFRLALNDPEGEWRLLATDAATGIQGEAHFTVAGH